MAMILKSCRKGGAAAAMVSAELYCGAAGRDHQHAAFLADHLVVQVHADHRIGTACPRLLDHLLDRAIAGLRSTPS